MKNILKLSWGLPLLALLAGCSTTTSADSNPQPYKEGAAQMVRSGGGEYYMMPVYPAQ
jgi:hypothetical protein